MEKVVRKSLVAANWKMNGSLAANSVWVEEFSAFKPVAGTDVVVFPPFVYIPTLKAKFADAQLNIGIGAQNCSAHDKGAYTGEISPDMLIDIGCDWVILGHSERRQMFGETDNSVAVKTANALKKGLRPIVCIGETEEQWSAGKSEEVVLSQLNAILDVVDVEEFADRGAIAYEPVWAIGTGKTATPEFAQAVHATLRDSVKSRNLEAADALRIIYGGSVKANNSEELFSRPDIDGGLIGGAGLKAKEFYAIVQSAKSLI